MHKVSLKLIVNTQFSGNDPPIILTFTETSFTGLATVTSGQVLVVSCSNKLCALSYERPLAQTREIQCTGLHV